MIETWQQITCNGCGETGNSDHPNMTPGQLRAEYRRYGWVYVPRRGSAPGGDYCKKCVEKGYAAARIQGMNEGRSGGPEPK